MQEKFRPLSQNISAICLMAAIEAGNYPAITSYRPKGTDIPSP
jgi:hypothetical protein